MNNKTIFRFFSKTKKYGECTIWIGAVDTNGRGRFWLEGKLHSSPRVAWEIFNGEIPKGMCVCHTCDKPACVEISHLFLGTQADNMQDMKTKDRSYKGGAKNPWNRSITHCKRGHFLSGDNLTVSNGRRVCRTCARASAERTRMKKIAKESEE